MLARTLLGELGASVRFEDLQVLRAWAHAWLRHVVTVFVRAYTSSVAGAGFLPDAEQCALLLFAYLLEKHAIAISRHAGGDASEVELAMDAIVALAR